MIDRRWLVAVLTAALSLASPALAQTSTPEWNGEIVKRDADWYAGPEARRIADAVVLHQSTEGGWPKNTSLLVPPDAAPVEANLKNTFDNQATTLPMAFLARVIHAGERPGDRASFDRGLDYILAAQYPNGGWPQFYPLRRGYYTHITFNDDAMVRVMTLLREIVAGAGPYDFVDPERRARAAAAVSKGVEVMLATQIRQGGVPTVWCAQHDETTLAPAWARAYEPPSLSGSESVGIVRFLMAIPDPSPEVVAAIQGAIRWFEASAITGVRFETTTAGDGRADAHVVADPDAPRIWARFYELETNRPIFLSRDSVVHYDFAEIERERRTGYRYYGTWPEPLLRDDYPAWRRRVGLS
ncbi:pectate lyase [Brevundimonas sp. Root1423]|uniref:pectate lyase n=1 Tax=Brevundimonas sp. Root1423 TaxID=1736462 RepID=UPI0006F8A4FF|nr:pectate lyase [Brevundimonas sp. Root1423]KQY75414.1 pectate lyase [Brevundimonas sp. Root1423]